MKHLENMFLNLPTHSHVFLTSPVHLPPHLSVFLPAGVADSEPVRPEHQATDVQRQHPEGAGGDLGILWCSLFRASGAFSEEWAAADREDQPLGSQAGKRLQHVELKSAGNTHSGFYTWQTHIQVYTVCSDHLFIMLWTLQLSASSFSLILQCNMVKN